ncbi:hypothetical protein TNCV_1773231 [Trichonephila clavipes]|nr:hypothetical protein TNCV_1773231 [Trichonephila clavipes]
MATGSYLTPNYSRSQSEIQGDLSSQLFLEDLFQEMINRPFLEKSLQQQQNVLSVVISQRMTDGDIGMMNWETQYPSPHSPHDGYIISLEILSYTESTFPEQIHSRFGIDSRGPPTLSGYRRNIEEILFLSQRTLKRAENTTTPPMKAVPTNESSLDHGTKLRGP